MLLHIKDILKILFPLVTKFYSLNAKILNIIGNYSVNTKILNTIGNYELSEHNSYQDCSNRIGCQSTKLIN